MGGTKAVSAELRAQSCLSPGAQKRPMRIDERVDAWLSCARVIACYPRETAINKAIGLCATQVAARMHSVQMLLQGPDSATNLPAATADPVITVGCEEYFTERSVALMDWLDLEWAMEPRMAVHHGVHLLAVVALAPKAERLILQGEKPEDLMAMNRPYLADVLPLNLVEAA